MQKSETALSERAENIAAGRVLAGIIAGTLIVQGILRLWVAGGLLLSPGIEGEFGGLVHWRVFDGFAGWIALMILAMAEAGTGLGRVFVRWVLGVGVLAFAASVMLGEVGGRAIVEIGVSGALALAGVLVAARQLIALSKAAEHGLNIEQLWRGVAAQWVLLWVAAEVTLRARFWKEGVESEEMARTLLFLLPVVGVGVNVMMAIGIRWWGEMRAAEKLGRGRGRAWLVAMGMVNAGAVLVMVGAVWARALGVAGAGVMIAGTGLYLVGFPRGAWRGGGWCVMAAFVGLVVGFAMMGGELAVLRVDVSEFYSAGWRHLLAAVEVVWLAGMGGLALRRVVEERIAAGARTAALVSLCMIVLGVCVTVGIFVAAMEDRDAVRGLFVGAAMQLAGVVVGAAVLMRAGKGVPR